MTNLVSTESEKKQQSMQEQDHVLVELRDFKASNEHSFLNDINNAPWQLLDIFNNIDDEIDIFYQLINQILDWHAPKRQQKVRNESYSWISSYVSGAIRQNHTPVRYFLIGKHTLHGTFTNELVINQQQQFVTPKKSTS